VGVTGYRVFRNSTLVATLGSVTTYHDTGLSAVTTYTYRIRAFDAAGNVSLQSNAASATTQTVPDITAPTVPTGLAATAISSSRIGLSWSPSTDNVAVTGYRVYRNDVFLATLGNVTTYESVGLSAATLYSYRVDAIDAVGNASSPTAAASATTLAPDTATLAWDAVIHPSLSGYRVYFGTASGTYAQTAGNGVDAGTATIHTITGLSSGTRYYFAVKAYDALNNESTFSIEVFIDIH
jgi:chitodextrinase